MSTSKFNITKLYTCTRVLNPIKMKGLSLAYSVSQWFVTTALANLRERPSESGSAQGESEPPDDEDDKDK